MRQASDEGAPAPGQVVLSSGSLGQLGHRFNSVASKVAFGKKVISSNCVRIMRNKKQRQKVRKRVECHSQTICKDWINEKLKALGQTLTNGHLSLEGDVPMPQASLQSSSGFITVGIWSPFGSTAHKMWLHGEAYSSKHSWTHMFSCEVSPKNNMTAITKVNW